MNFAEIDRCIDGNRADTPETLELLHEGMVKHGGIQYFEFPVMLDASKIRASLVAKQDEFEKFQSNAENKKFPEDAFDDLKKEFDAVLKEIAFDSGKGYRKHKDWKHIDDINTLKIATLALANLAHPEYFISGVGTPDTYNQKYMEHIREISDFQNAWDLRNKWPVIFSPDYIDTWQQPGLATGHHTKYWLPRQRFKRLAKGGSAGLWVDKWMSELLGKEVRMANKGQFLDIHAQWITEYMNENPL